MFDRYVLHQSPSHVTQTTHEHRAPTDESVRLLREMEAAAKSSVVESMRLKSGELEAVVHRHELPYDLRTVFVIHYAINGHKRRCEVGFFDVKKIDEVLDTLWKRLAEDIAALIIEMNIKAVVRK